MNQSKQEIVVYTDGACSGNPGPAGAGAVMYCGSYYKELCEPLGEATNNIAELMAIKIALETIKKKNWPIKLYTDSQYALGVLNGDYKARKNKELIFEIRTIMQEFPFLQMLKVPGHSGVEGNEKADKLANLAVETCQNQNE